MSLRFYNSFTGKKEEFIPLDPNCVNVYSCGPTVYNLNHIGNFRAYVFTDLLRRYLKYRGYKINHTVNITDVEDKIIANAHEKNQTISEFTEPFIKEYLEDLDYLGIEQVEHRPKATDSILEMIDIINRLKKNGNAYDKDGNVYFRLKSFSEYGKLSGLDSENLVTAADGRFDVDEYEKEDARDFALWKTATKKDKAVHACWQTPFGEGRPGWHLECSAMIRKIYGNKGIDIHTGGIDLLFPHHENEIAQSCCAWPDQNFVNFWLHNEHLLVEGKKMSKSAGNFFTLRELTNEKELQKVILDKRAPDFMLEILQSGKMPKAMRYILISTHYRQKLNFTFDGIKSASSAIDNISNNLLNFLEILNIEQDCLCITLEQINFNSLKPSEIVEASKGAFIEAMDDDLNISKAMASVFDLLKKLNNKIKNGNSSSMQDELIYALHHIIQINEVLNILDLDFNCYKKEILNSDFVNKINSLIQARKAAREEKNYKRSDEIRDELIKNCIQIKDTPDGTTWEQIK